MYKSPGVLLSYNSTKISLWFSGFKLSKSHRSNTANFPWLRRRCTENSYWQKIWAPFSRSLITACNVSCCLLSCFSSIVWLGECWASSWSWEKLGGRRRWIRSERANRRPAFAMRAWPCCSSCQADCALSEPCF